MKRTAAIIASILLASTLTACSGKPAADQSAHNTPAATTEETAAGEAASDTATSEQLASVIARYKPGWEETINVECRIPYMYAETTPEDKTEALICGANNETLILEAGLALEELAELTPTTDMESLYAETIDLLQRVSESPFQTDCDTTGPDLEDAACLDALNEHEQLLRDLQFVLNSWAPYI